MEEELARAWTQLVGRLTGPLALRLVFQPLMAIFLAVRAGLADARAGRPAYLWSVVTNAEARHLLIESGWYDIARVFALAIGIDAVYQVLVLDWFYPLQALIVACLLAIVPYVALRGPVTRFARRSRVAAWQGDMARGSHSSPRRCRS